jgi:hypothetical protein
MAAWPRSNEERTMSRKAELDAFRSEFMAHVPPEVRDAMVRAEMELAASGIAQRALKAGDRAPDFSLPDARGGYVRLNGPLAAGQSFSVSTEAAGAHIAISNCGHCSKPFPKSCGSAPRLSPSRRRLRMRAFRPRRRMHLVREVGYGLSLEGASAAAHVKSMQSKS